MKPCDHLPQYLDGRLERAGREYFESHLHICADCRKLADVWVCTKNALRNEAEERRLHLVPTDEEASRLVQRAQLEASSRGFFSVRVLVPLTACVSFALAFVLASKLDDFGTSIPETSMHREAKATLPVSEGEASFKKPPLEYETKKDGRTTGRFGNDRFGLAAQSKLRVVSTEGKTTLLRLDYGIAAFSVAKRKGGRKFVVEAGDYRVEVVGTRFTVDRSGDGVRVSVTEGVVAVSENGGRKWRLAAGDALSVAPGAAPEHIAADEEEIEKTARLLGETAECDIHDALLASATDTMSFEIPKKGKASALSNTSRRRSKGHRKAQGETSLSLHEDAEGPRRAASSAKPETNGAAQGEAQTSVSPDESAPKGMDLWRQWILEGRFEVAEAALSEHLSGRPLDTEAYSLLADCRRKAGKYAQAVEIYKKLTAIAGEYQANRARFKAGVLMQEKLKNHLGAAAIFDEYLATGKGTPLLRAKAAIRLAGSLIELGEVERAGKLLRRIADDYSGSSVAIQAREMLKKID